MGGSRDTAAGSYNWHCPEAQAQVSFRGMPERWRRPHHPCRSLRSLGPCHAACQPLLFPLVLIIAKEGRGGRGRRRAEHCLPFFLHGAHTPDHQHRQRDLIPASGALATGSLRPFAGALLPVPGGPRRCPNFGAGAAGRCFTGSTGVDMAQDMKLHSNCIPLTHRPCMCTALSLPPFRCSCSTSDSVQVASMLPSTCSRLVSSRDLQCCYRSAAAWHPSPRLNLMPPLPRVSPVPLPWSPSGLQPCFAHLATSVKLGHGCWLYLGSGVEGFRCGYWRRSLILGVEGVR